MHKCDMDGIYVVVNGNQYRLEYDSFSVGTTSSKCAKCDFFKEGCNASESCRRIENQFPDSYWKLTSHACVTCGGNSSTQWYAHAVLQNELGSCLVCTDNGNGIYENSGKGIQDEIVKNANEAIAKIPPKVSDQNVDEKPQPKKRKKNGQ